jgi:hypothetical protein
MLPHGDVSAPRGAVKFATVLLKRKGRFERESQSKLQVQDAIIYTCQ